MFDYKSNVENDGWWHQEFDTFRKLKFYVYLAEIAGCKFEQFTSFIDFDRFVNTFELRRSKIYSSIEFVMKAKKYIIAKNQFRLIEKEVNKTRRIRAKKINKLPTSYNILKLLVKASKNSLPTVLNIVIIKEFLGLDNFIGCINCKKAGRSLDTVISHQTEMCKFNDKSQQCLHCSNFSYICTSHISSKCSHYEDQRCYDYLNDICDYRGRPNCTIHNRDDYNYDDDDDRGDYGCDCCGKPNCSC